MATSSPEENPKSSAQSFRRFIQKLQDENDLVVIDSEVDPHLELAAIVQNVHETEDKAPLFNNVKGRQENGLFRILGAPAGASKIPGKTFIRIAKPLGLPSDASGVVYKTETASEGPMAEYHGNISPGESKKCPIFKVDAITYRNDPILPTCITVRAFEESETVWGLMQAAEVLTICQDAGLPIKMVLNPFGSHCIWFVLQVDRYELGAMETTMEECCNKVGHVVFASKSGFYIPTVYLVGDDIDPTNFKGVVWAAAIRCQLCVNKFFF
ncbi:Ferulic acid decarboxylase 1 [Fusarium sp. Ph1]|nr:Ferulic acid decarboxylase 1 [Fusarium sp. Ph1]